MYVYAKRKYNIFIENFMYITYTQVHTILLAFCLPVSLLSPHIDGTTEEEPLPAGH